MTGQNDLERTLGAWFGAYAAAPPPPAPLARIIETTRSRRPRPSAVARLGSHWVVGGSVAGEDRRSSLLRPALVIALVALLALALSAAALLVGGRLLVRPVPPTVHEFVSAPDLSRPMAYPHLAALVDGRVLVIGAGSDREDPALMGIVYDPANGVSVSVEALADVRVGPLVRLRDGRVLILAERFAGVFDPTTQRLQPAGPMTTARSWPAAAALQDGRILIAGGIAGTELLTAELFDPETLTFSPAGHVAQQATSTLELGQESVVEEGIATLPDGRVFVPVSMPVNTAEWRIEAEIYDAGTGTFSGAGTMPDVSINAAIVIPDGRVALFGSTAFQRAGIAHLWDPGTRTFSRAADPPGPVSTATLLGDGGILLTGQRDAYPTTSWAGIYDPTSGATIPIEPPSAWRPSLVRLDDGRVLAVGGLLDGRGRLIEQVMFEAPSVPTVQVIQ